MADETLGILIALILPLAGTTAGACLVFFLKDALGSLAQKILLGFAAGVMVAASIWSLILPSIEMAEQQQVIAWIPAESLSETTAIVNSADITVGQTGFRFPSGTTPKEITINFIDDYRGRILRWLKSWVDDIILCRGEGINFLSECIDILEIYDLLPNKIVNETRKYYVYHDGAISLQYTSDSGIKVYSVNFVVTGQL